MAFIITWHMEEYDQLSETELILAFNAVFVQSAVRHFAKLDNFMKRLAFSSGGRLLWSKVFQDKEGNQVWICPACGGQDDGSPMIGCDGCDAWYHWVCVGIQVPPDSNDWFCRVCIAKRQDGLVPDKKKKGEKKKKKA